MDQSKEQSLSPESLRQDEGFEFELTDIEEARRMAMSQKVLNA